VRGAISLLAATMLAMTGKAPLPGDDAGVAPPVASTTACDSFPQVTCTCTNAGVASDILQMATDARDRMGPLLRLGPKWLFPVHIYVVMPDDPQAEKLTQARVSAIATNSTIQIEAVLPSSTPSAREFIQKQFVTALLWEKFLASVKTPDVHTRLDIVPLWLGEGLREWLNEDPEHERESIVRHAVAAHRAPTLEEVASWRELSDDRLLGIWQRAFCYYLVNSLIREPARRQNFQQWVDSLAGPNPAAAQFLFPTEMGWQRELVDATSRSRDIVYTWEESSAELTAAEMIAIPAAQSSDTRICTLDTVLSFPLDQPLAAALQKKIFDLTSLELRLNQGWRPVAQLYRYGLSALLNHDAKHAQDLIAQAQGRRAGEIHYHQKLVDYINWFEVTKDYLGNNSRFRAYFSTVREMEQVEADPVHPNPIRASLIQVESKL
jgi:hypothetical protein